MSDDTERGYPLGGQGLTDALIFWDRDTGKRGLAGKKTEKRTYRVNSETGPLLIWKTTYEDLSWSGPGVGKGCPRKADMTSLHILKEKHRHHPAKTCGKSQDWREAGCLALGDRSLGNVTASLSPIPPLCVWEGGVRDWDSWRRGFSFAFSGSQPANLASDSEQRPRERLGYK